MAAPVERNVRRRRFGVFRALALIGGLILLASLATFFIALRGLSGDPLPSYHDLAAELIGRQPTTAQVPSNGATPQPVTPVEVEIPPEPESEPEAEPESEPAVEYLGPQQPTGDFAAEVFAEANQARLARGLPALAFSQCAADQATARATALIGTGTLEHAPLAPVIAACNPPGLRTAENLLRGEVSAAQGVQMWLDSPGHAANLLDPELTMMGLGCVRDPSGPWPGWICAQVFLG